MPNPTKIRSIRRFLAVLLPLVVLAACSDLVGSGVEIRSFTAAEDPGNVGAFVLSWSVEGLEGGSLTLEPAPDGSASLDVMGITNAGTGHVEVSPQVNTEYRLTAVSGLAPSQTDTASVVVVVPEAPVIQDFTADVAPVNPGLETTLRWQVENDPTLRLFGPGLAADGVDVTGSNFFRVTPEASADYTLVASNPYGDDEASVTDVGREFPAASFLIAGQSNAQGRNVSFEEALGYDIPADAGVRMLGNDYVWQEAYEPTDDCTNQVDLVSRDPSEPGAPCNSGVSFGVSFGNEARTATGGTVFLIPAAKGGSTIGEWEPRSDRYDRSSLFGSAAFRAQLAGIQRGAPLGYASSGNAYGAILWYQGESDTNNLSEAENLANRTDGVFDTFQIELDAPIVFAQLGRIYERMTGGYNEDGRNMLFQIVRDAQIGLEDASIGRHMVVTHDLPMADRVHLSAEGQEELGRRMSLAYREHLLGDSEVDGTGPRVLDVFKAGSSTVEVHFDRRISESGSTGADAYNGYFAVFSSGGEQLGVQSIILGTGLAGAESAVVITLDKATSDDVEVRYLPPKLPTDEGSGMLADVVRSAVCNEPMPDTGLCLPAPAFGTATSGVSLQSLQFEDLDTY